MKIIKRGVFILAAILVLLLFSFFSRGIDLNKVSPEVMEKASHNEKVKVIVEMENKPSFIAQALSNKKPEKEYISMEVRPEDIADLASDSDVVKITADKDYVLQLYQSVPQINASVAHATVFNNQNLTGISSTVCIIDTGVNSSHESLAGRVIAEYCYCSADSGCCPNGSSEQDNAMDGNGHGTHVSGIAAAGGNIIGVARGANLAVVKVFSDSGSTTATDIIQAIGWCIDHKDQYNITAISMSLGSTTRYTSYCDSTSPFTSEINRAVANNIAVVASTGNDYDYNGISDPGCVKNTTAVSAVTKSDTFPGYANRNNITDLVAPGGDSSNPIVSTSYQGGSKSMFGTSMAAPHVSGAVAILAQYKRLEGNPASPEEIESYFKDSGLSLYDSNSNLTFKRIDVFSALLQADAAGPTISAANYTPQEVRAHTNLTLYVNASDIRLSSVWVNGNFSGSFKNYSMHSADGQKYSITIDSANFSANQNLTWRFFSNDSKGHVSFSPFYSTIVINYPPNVTLNSPPSNTFSKENNIAFNYTASDDFDSTLNCSLYIDEILNKTNSSVLTNTISTFNAVLIDGTHNWSIRCFDNQSLEGNSSAVLNVDSSAPVFKSINYSQTLEIGDYQDVIVNISDLNFDYANISYKSENITMNCSNICSYSLLCSSYGHINISILAKDRAGNINTTNFTFFVNDSSAEPRIKSVSFSSSVDSGDGQNINALIFDRYNLTNILIDYGDGNMSMNAHSSYNYSYSWNTSGCGTLNFTIFAKNSINHSSVYSSNFSVADCCGDDICSSSESCSSCSTDCGACSSTPSSSSGSGGGGGGGGGGSVAEDKATILIDAGGKTSIDIKIKKKLIPVKEIRIKLKAGSAKGKIRVNKAGNYPAIKDRKVYSAFSIELARISKEEIAGAEIMFYVNSSWLSKHSIKPSDVVLLRYNKGWNELKTEFEGRENSEYKFRAFSPGFSYFAVSARETGKNSMKNETLVKTQSKKAELDNIPMQSENSKKAQDDVLKPRHNMLLSRFLIGSLLPPAVSVLKVVAFLFAMFLPAVSVYYFKRKKKTSRCSGNEKQNKQNNQQDEQRQDRRQKMKNTKKENTSFKWRPESPKK